MTRFEKLLLHTSTAIAALTGLVYLAMKHLLHRQDPFSVVNHPWQPHVLAAHVLVGPLVVFAIGLIAREHILARFLERRPGRGRASGMSTMLLAAPMVASGYLLQVVTGEATRGGLVVAHVAAGGLFALVLGAHHLAATSRRGDTRTEAAARSSAPAGSSPRLD